MSLAQPGEDLLRHWVRGLVPLAVIAWAVVAWAAATPALLGFTIRSRSDGRMKAALTCQSRVDAYRTNVGMTAGAGPRGTPGAWGRN